MPRIPIPDDISSAPAGSQELLYGVQSKFGVVPNVFRMAANSPAALKALLGIFEALEGGKIDAATGERIALAVANVNGCNYCNAAHSYFASNLKLSQEEIAANREGRSLDPKVDAAVSFARKLTIGRGALAEDDLESVKAAGYGNAELIEVVAHVALNVFTNYLNEAFGTEIDFPEVPVARRIAA